MTELDISNKGLQNPLNLTGFINLNKLNCFNNQLIYLDLSNLNQLSVIDCRDNNLRSIKFPSQLEQLNELYISDNDFPEQDLSLFRKMVNLKRLEIGNNSQKKIIQETYNRFIGSLEPLKNLTKLERLDISNTDIDSGLEYLFDSVEDLDCSFSERPEARVNDIWEELHPYRNNLKNWRKVKWNKKLPLTTSPLLPPQLINKIKKGNKI